MLAVVKNKYTRDPSLKTLVEKADDKVQLLGTFVKDCRMKIAVWESIDISDQVPDDVLENVETLINEQVAYVENAKIAKKRMQSVL